MHLNIDPPSNGIINSLSDWFSCSLHCFGVIKQQTNWISRGPKKKDELRHIFQITSNRYTSAKECSNNTYTREHCVHRCFFCVFEFLFSFVVLFNVALRRCSVVVSIVAAIVHFIHHLFVSRYSCAPLCCTALRFSLYHFQCLDSFLSINTFKYTLCR